MKGFILFLFLLSIVIIGCKDESVVEPPPEASASVHTIYNVPADTGSANKVTYFRFSDSTIVTGNDTVTANWDMGFKSTTIYTNSGSSGQGQGGAVLLTNVDFSSVTEAPSDGYNIDATGAPAIPTGSGNGWYNYSGPPSHLITPKPGVVLVIRTGSGKYAKVQILSYYLNAPESPTGAEPTRFYTFKYLYQPDGSKSFE